MKNRLPETKKRKKMSINMIHAKNSVKAFKLSRKNICV